MLGNGYWVWTPCTVGADTSTSRGDGGPGNAYRSITDSAVLNGPALPS